MENEFETYFKERKSIIFFDPVTCKFWNSDETTIRKLVESLMAWGIAQKENSFKAPEETINYWLRCLHAENSHLEDPFLERLYSMKGLVV